MTKAKNPPSIRRRVSAVCLVALALALLSAGCGSSSSTTSKPTVARSSTSPSTTTATTNASSTSAALPPAIAELGAAEHPRGAEFPPAHGRTLQQLATLVKSTASFGAATGTFTPGRRRLAFGLNASSGAFIYAPTAVYIAATAHSPAQGPFLAPADPMSVPAQYRSKQNAGPGGIQAIYATQLPIPHAGTFTVLSLTRTAKGLIGAPGEIAVAAHSPIPNVGDRAPDVATDTLATVGGNVSLLTTRQPPEHMHSVSLRAVLGKRPVALLFSTPQFCVSRICGPVTDVDVSLQRQFAGRITFIHEEVYAHNQPKLGLRSQMKAFHLETEPWLFAINRHGVITARLEGAFGTTELRAALESALR
jgi:hypothetical protein